MGGEKQVVILQHVANENAGTLLDHLRREKIPFREIHLFESGYRLPEISEMRALIVMGGPMNVYEEERYPFLAEENRFIREAVENSVPFLGICLGSQLLAKALGAKVYKAAQEEIGWQEVTITARTASDAVFGPLGLKKMKVLQWHGDTFDLPHGAAHLASSAVVPHQAYALRGRFYGLQFHLEVNRAMLEEWFKNRPERQAVLDEYETYRPQLGKLTETIYKSFFSLS